METVYLTKTGRLMAAEGVSSVHTDVTQSAGLRLFDVVELEPGITLRAVFQLLSANATLREVFLRQCPPPMLAEALDENLPYELRGGIDPARVEYAELHRSFEVNSDTGVLDIGEGWQIHGAGFSRTQDEYDNGNPTVTAGTRGYFSFEMTSCRALLHLPLQVCTEVPVFEESMQSPQWGKRTATYQLTELTLGEFLQGVLSGLAYDGPPSEDEATVEASDD